MSKCSTHATAKAVGAPDTEIEITPEMIEAGLRVLYDSNAIEHPLWEADRQLAEKVFRAMAGAAAYR